MKVDKELTAKIVERILSLIAQRDENVYTVAKNAKLSYACIQRWGKGRSGPSTETVTILARYFNVSADYLLCLSDEPTPLN